MIEIRKIGGSFAGLRHPIKYIAVIQGRAMLRSFSDKNECKKYAEELASRLKRKS